MSAEANPRDFYAFLAEFRHLPAIIRFLGYNPIPRGKTVGQRVRRTRQALGLSQKKLALYSAQRSQDEMLIMP